MFKLFIQEFQRYFLEVAPYLLIGFFLSGVMNEYLPGDLVKKHLGGKGFRPILFSSLFGTFLPVCCIGSLPIAIGLYHKGARLGPTLAFLVTTPATSISALIVCYVLLGIRFTVFIFFAVIILGLVAGLAGNLVKREQRESPAPPCGCNERGEFKREKKARFFSIVHYAFWEMPREMGLEILIGLALAAVIASAKPIGQFVGDHLDGAYGYVFSVPFGLIMYICSTASVPLVDAFIRRGMNPGAGMVLLMVGPVTSLSAILVLRKAFGYRILALYLVVICAVSLLMGILFSALS